VRLYTIAHSTTDDVASDYVGQGIRRVMDGDGGWRSFSMRFLDHGLAPDWPTGPRPPDT
jgi:hypothetical protein